MARGWYVALLEVMVRGWYVELLDAKAEYPGCPINVRSEPLTLAGQRSILTGAPTVLLLGDRCFGT